MSEKPNIILINCDDLGYGDLGCYGSKLNETPHLDKMAQEGMLFTDFYMASCVCSPSRGAMMTGCYPPRIGFGDFDGGAVLFPGSRNGLNPDEETIASTLKRSGYRTKHVGKWHCGDQKEFLPTNFGFDEYYGLPYSNDMGIQRGTKIEVPLPLIKDKDVIQEQPDQRGLTERYLQESLSFIRKDPENPFFLYLAHMYVHVPLFVPAHFLKNSKNGGYGGAVACIDWVLGMLEYELEKLGIVENTWIIFTSDNGSRARDEGGSNGELRGRKSTTWDGGFRVPCIMKWPRMIPSATTCSEIVSSIDFLPTLASVIGADLDESRTIDGVNLEPLLRAEFDKSPPRDEFVFYGMNNLCALRAGSWKLHVCRSPKNGVWLDPEDVEELYNLSLDPGEEKNVAQENPEIVKTLRKRIEYWRQELGDDFSNTEGKNNRASGLVSDPRPLTTFDESHPYMVAYYDLSDGKVMCG